MAALTAAATIRWHHDGFNAYLAAAVDIFFGGLYVLNAAGLLAVPADTAAFMFVGVAVSESTPNIDGFGTGVDRFEKVTGTGVAGGPEVTIDERGVVLEAVDVAGALAQTDVGTLGYLTAADDNPATTLTQTASVNLNAVGYINRFLSATSYNFKLFSTSQYLGDAAL